MKNLMFLVLGVLVFTGCSQSDNNDSPYYRTLSGNWVITGAYTGSSVKATADNDGYLKSENLTVVGTKPFGPRETKLYLKFDTTVRKLTITTFVLENGKKVSSSEVLDFSVLSTEIVIPAAQNWNMILLNSTGLALKRDSQTITFTRVLPEVLAAESNPATFNLDISGEKPSYYARNIVHTGTVGLMDDPEIECVVNAQKELAVSISENKRIYFKLNVNGFESVGTFSLQDTSRINAAYKEERGDETLSVSGGTCGISSQLETGKLKLSFSCANSEGTSTNPKPVEKLNVSGSVTCRLASVPNN